MTKQEITQALRDFLAMGVTDKEFPLRKEAYKMLGEKPAKKPAKKGGDGMVEIRGWEPLETMPRGRPVEALSATGLIRTVTVSPKQKIEKGRIYCWGPVGSVTAVKWRELDVC